MDGSQNERDYFVRLRNKVNAYQLFTMDQAKAQQMPPAQPMTAPTNAVSVFSDKFRKKVQAVHEGAHVGPKPVSNNNSASILFQPTLSQPDELLDIDAENINGKPQIKSNPTKPAPIASITLPPPAAQAQLPTPHAAMFSPMPPQSDNLIKRSDLSREERIALMKNRKRSNEDRYNALSSQITSSLAQARALGSTTA
eukprot:c1169_g1_i1.p1 GENE.c1169_g1_i1~~c1169_g1_i1.p1  ORF type:complete len:220 (+),score=32.35 c1169_g1_i1:71-661(+)